MTNDEFVASLSADQNTALLAYRDSINAMHNTAEQAFVAVNQSQKSTITTLTAERDTAVSVKAGLETRVREAEDAVWDRRKIAPDALYDRLTKQNVRAIGILGSKDKVAVQLLAKLELAAEERKIDPAYLISLDDAAIAVDIDYLVTNRALNADDRTRLVADSRRDEQ